MVTLVGLVTLIVWCGHKFKWSHIVWCGHFDSLVWSHLFGLAWLQACVGHIRVNFSEIAIESDGDSILSSEVKDNPKCVHHQNH